MAVPATISQHKNYFFTRGRLLFKLNRLGKNASDFFFPQFCVGCSLEGDILCVSCLGKLERISPPFCNRCGLPQNGTGPCRDCSGSGMCIDGIRSSLLFKKLTREIIHQFKYKNLRAFAPFLASLLNESIANYCLTADALIPVPLHPARLRGRGYNQAFLLAAELEKLSHIPVYSDILSRTTNTIPQAKTSNSRERRKNMQGSFMCKYGKLKDKRVLLIDDVATSGATLDACAFSLKQAGAVSVWGLTVAREV